MSDPFESQPLRRVFELTRGDLPEEPGVYAWYRAGRLFYVGETHRGLRSRLWGNHIRGNARGSTLRNKVAEALGLEPLDFRRYGREAERRITEKLRECDVRFCVLPREEVSPTQTQLIVALDAPMNDHAGQVPRWRIDEVRRILGIDIEDESSAPPPPATPRRPAPARRPALAEGERQTQRITARDLADGRIRLPRAAKSLLPPGSGVVRLSLRGCDVEARWDPRKGPDRERSGVLRVRRDLLARLVREDEVLRLAPTADGTVALD